MSGQQQQRTNYMEQWSHSLEDDSCSFVQEILHLLWNPKVLHYRVNPPLDPILRQVKLVYNFTLCLLKIHGFESPPSLLYSGYQGLFPWGWGGRSVGLTIHLHLAPKSRMSGAIPSLPQYVFMEWCSVKKSTGTILPSWIRIPLGTWMCFRFLSVLCFVVLC
jgi:hypothetical protein